MKNGIIFQSAENERKVTGPGYYNLSSDTLNKSSFNVRASGGRAPSAPRTRPMSRENSQSNLSYSHAHNGETSPNPGSSFKGNTGNVGSNRPRSSTAPRQRGGSNDFSTPLRQ